MKKLHPDFETRMMWKGRTGLPMNVAIDDGYAYDFQRLPFKQVGFQMDTDENLNKDNWNAMGLDGTLCDLDTGELQKSDLAQLRNFVVLSQCWGGKVAKHPYPRRPCLADVGQPIHCQRHGARRAGYGFAPASKIVCPQHCDITNYYPCDSMHEYVLGNVRENTVEEIWKGEKLNYLRGLKNRDFGSCATCGNRPWCMVCPAANFNATGDLFTHHPNTCALAGVVREVYGNA